MKSLPPTLVTLALAVLLASGCVAVPAPPPATVELPSAGAAPATSVPSAITPAPTGRVPLAGVAASMNPADVFENFYAITQVPRPSHHEEKISAFLAQFGRDLGLETEVDALGNVIIRKPAAAGMENRQGVILQGHMDMVGQTAPGVTHDWENDPIQAYVEDDWVVAGDTTLGADDGIGLALIMAILQSKTLSLGPIEALLTVNEEDGMDGALGLQPGVLNGSILINLDSEDEGVFTIGSAGGVYADISNTYAEAPAPAATTAYSITIDGLKGGHSGVDIDLGRGHATKLLVRLLSQLSRTDGVRLASLAGGTAANAITTSATALVVVPDDKRDAFVADVKDYETTVKSELAAVEPGLQVNATAAGMPAKVMDEAAQQTLIDALYANPQGVIRMSDEVEGLVETSTNMGIVSLGNGGLEVICYLRSSVDSELDDLSAMVASVWDLASTSVAFNNRFSGWKADPDSQILLLMKRVYQDLYGKEPEVQAVHAGLECGTIVASYPGMEAISIGPTLKDVHTTGERLQVSTVGMLNDLLIETLKQIPER